MKVLVTGCAGFIGANLSRKLLNKGYQVIGVDNLTDYYSISLKKLRLLELESNPNFSFIKFDLCKNKEVKDLVKKHMPSAIVHLAAQPGVRLSSEKYESYINSNLLGFSNLMQWSTHYEIKSILFASSSSVYGDGSELPFIESQSELSPKSFYGGTKLANEILAKSLSKHTESNIIGMRFFTVYGPMGRPDMAYFKLARKIIFDEEFELFGDGTAIRDFTYIDDVSESICKLINYTQNSGAGLFEIFNIGGGQPRSMHEMIGLLETNLGKTAKILRRDLITADVVKTTASTKKQLQLVNYVPTTELEVGIEKFCNWLRNEVTLEQLRNWS